MVDETVASKVGRIYFSAWSKKLLTGYNKVSLVWVIVLGPTGEVAYCDSEEKTIAKFPGWMTQKKMRGAVRAHVLLQGKDYGYDFTFSHKDVIARYNEKYEDVLQEAKNCS